MSWTILAHLLRPQGRKGEVLAELFTDFPESLTGRSGLFLIPAGFAGTAEEARTTKVLSSWLPVGKNRGRIVLAIEGIDSISEAESLADLDLAVRDESRMVLEEESTYVSDLVGCAVFDGEKRVGVVTGVQFPTSPAGDRLEDIASLLEVRDAAGDELLIPFVKDFLLELDLAKKRLVLRLPPGLIEVNRSATKAVREPHRDDWINRKV